MKPSRLALVIAAGFCLLCSGWLFAKDVGFPFGADHQYSADVVLNTSKGLTVTYKIYGDIKKVRIETNVHDANLLHTKIVTIIRHDLQKNYQVADDLKTVAEMPYDPSEYKNRLFAPSGPEGKYEMIGPDTVNGVACTKYKVTNNSNKSVFYWADAATQAPVKAMAENGSSTLFWNNYKTSPQDASLFELPVGYTVITVPSEQGTNKPGGAGQ